MRVAALLLIDDNVVLVRHRSGDSTYHLLPGGGVAYRETCEDALRREVAEETGLEARVVRPLFVSDTIDPHGSRHVVNLTFLAEVVGGAVTSAPADPRVEAVELVAPELLASLDLRPPMAEQIVAALSAGVQQAPACYLGPLFTEGR